MKVTHWLFAMAVSAGLGGASFGQIAGKVVLEGKIPEMAEIKGVKDVPYCAQAHKDPVYEETVVAGDKGELANVVVSIKPADGQTIKGDIPKTPAALDQKGCVYKPHVLAVMAGQEITVKNSDDTMHNVHALAVDNPVFNFAQPSPGVKKLDPLTAPEAFKVKCDVHPWMNAWIVVLDNPFFATTGEDGTYTIDTKGLPDGEYTLQAWQEKYGKSEQKVTVKDGKATKAVDFTYKSDEKAAATPAPGLQMKLASGAPCCTVQAAGR